MLSQKYGRTYHFPFSPGTTSDDRINYTYWDNIQQIETLVHTEKLDGENNCLNRFGVFARSHVAPTTSAWTNQIRERWEIIKHDLDDIELFGENLYAVHSIEYKQIESYYYIFAVRSLDKWLSWEEVKFYAAMFDFPTVPELATVPVTDLTQDKLKEQILTWAGEPAIFGSVDTQTGKDCTREGIVSRNSNEYAVKDFPQNVFKYVRKGHVKTNKHWTRNWKRAQLSWEKER
ncbi:RNA ligase family protein [Dysgonomonas sp. Marseille-P4677]|uniref:RNA ligase family protein n=1 Tax=Dysgonomonas sp. Marseille-P4677 TaxID=2364790 RepID=UPI001912CA1A|nr:RNA ligase family protein [Dysgonomonas sp. Marseille-P4677]MBK5721063.1 RNA ligase family protein [Dysgonomonas sp. Marseille-P4677]